MKIPDKIYLPENLSNSDKIRLSSVDEKGRGIPYVRKDALLEWAKMMQEGTDGLISAAYAVMVNKIESL